MHKPAHEFRHYNLLVVCEAINTLLAQRDQQDTVSKAQIFAALNPLFGSESLSALQSAFMDCSGEQGFGIFDSVENGRYHFASVSPARLAATRGEAAALESLLRSEAACLLLQEETRDILRRNISAYHAPDAERSGPPQGDAILAKGQSKLRDALDSPALIDNFRLINTAIAQHKSIRCRFDFNGRLDEKTLHPQQFSYSPLDGRLRVICIDESGETAPFYVANMYEASIVPPVYKEAAAQPGVVHADFYISGGKNAIERVSGRLSAYEKELFSTEDAHYSYRMRLYYAAHEQPLIVSRLLSAGNCVYVITPRLRDALLREARKALGNYGTP